MSSARLVAGTRIGDYQVVSVIGAGGMGEVYRARDVRLHREVALKLLPAAFVFDEHRRARLQHEARMLASVNHANIATLYDLEPSPLGDVLVMELVDGETLADRIALAGGGGLPLPDVLRIAQQIAAALEAAHDLGIIHRDLKPSNIAVRPDGTVKVLDFGLATTLTSPAGATTPTVTDFSVRIAGTPAYSSPEQARGAPVDKRADIWAFGCVLFEMLTGQRPFPASENTDVLAQILEREPDFTLLPSTVPEAVRRVLRRCLAKDVRERLRDIGDARLELQEALHTPAQAPSPASRGRARWAWSLAAITLVAASAIAVWAFTTPAAPRLDGVTRFVIPVSLVTPGSRLLTMAPDGSRLAYLSPRGLTIRSRDRLDEAVLDIDSWVMAPFFSADGQWVAFTDGQNLLKMPVGGGSPVSIGAVGAAAVGGWTRDGLVVADVRGLHRITGDGRQEPLVMSTALGASEQASYPELLPGGRAVLFTVLPTRQAFFNSAAGNPGARVEVLDLSTGVRRSVVPAGSRGQYVPTGHVVYASGDALYAVPFDVNGLRTRGQPVKVVTGVVDSEFAISETGVLTYLSGNGAFVTTLAWLDRNGREEPLDAPPQPYLYPRLSPDGTRVALDVIGADRDIWMWDMRRRSLERFTIDPAGNPIAAWSPDGTHIAFGSDRYGPTNLFIQRVDRADQPRRLIASERLQMPVTFAPDGRLIFSELVPERGRDIMALSLDGSGRVQSLVHSPGQDGTAEVSPDGRWLAYDSNESGQFEIYVRPYPDTDRARWQISVAGGRQPVWSPDGRELFYRDFAGAIMSAPVHLTPTFSAGQVVKLLDARGYTGSGQQLGGRTYDVSRDGQRFLMLKIGAAPARSAVVVLNWFDELNRLVPPVE